MALALVIVAAVTMKFNKVDYNLDEYWGLDVKAIIQSGHVGFPGHRGVPGNAANDKVDPKPPADADANAADCHVVADHADADVCHSAVGTSSSATNPTMPSVGELPAAQGLAPDDITIDKCKERPSPPSRLPSTKLMLPVAAMPIDKVEPFDPARLMQKLLSVQVELREVKEQRDLAEDRCRHFEKRCHSEEQMEVFGQVDMVWRSQGLAM